MFLGIGNGVARDGAPGVRTPSCAPCSVGARGPLLRLPTSALANLGLSDLTARSCTVTSTLTRAAVIKAGIGGIGVLFWQGAVLRRTTSSTMLLGSTFLDIGNGVAGDDTQVKLTRMTIAWRDAWVLCLTVLRAPR